MTVDSSNIELDGFDRSEAPSAGDLIVYPENGRLAIWLGVDHINGGRGYFYLGLDGTLYRSFSSRPFIVVSRLRDGR